MYIKEECVKFLLNFTLLFNSVACRVGAGLMLYRIRQVKKLSISKLPTRKKVANVMTKDIGKEFMEKTKYKYMDDSDQDKGLPQPKLQLDYDKNAVLIELPPIENLKVKNIDLRTAIESRKSIRKYTDTFLTLE